MKAVKSKKSLVIVVSLLIVAIITSSVGIILALASSSEPDWERQFTQYSGKTMDILRGFDPGERINYAIETDNLLIEDQVYMISLPSLLDLLELTDADIQTDGLWTVIVKDGYTLRARAGTNTIHINGDEVDLEKPLAEIGGVLYFPLDIAAEAFGYEVETDAYAEKISLTRPFQAKRLIVQATGTIDRQGAVDWASGFNGYNLHQYKTEQEAREALKYYQTLGNVAWAGPDLMVEEDASPINEQEIKTALNTAVGGQYSVTAAGQSYMSWGAEAIGANKFTSYLQRKGVSNLPQVVVAVLDSGIYSGHTVFNNRIALGGKNFTTVGTTLDVTDTVGTGTHAAGTIVDLTLPNVKILPIKVVANNSTLSSVLNAIEYVNGLRKNGTSPVRVMAITSGISSLIYSDYFKTVIQSAYDLGIVTVLGSGDQNQDTGTSQMPSAINAITVGAVNTSISVANFSNYGNSLGISAPGVGVFSAGISGVSSVVSRQGTSVASAHLAGAVALLLSDTDFTTEDAVETVLRNAVKPSGFVSYMQLVYGTWNSRYGFGLINLDIVADAQTPKIVTHPKGETVTLNSQMTLSVSATVTDGGTLSYKWYYSETNTTTGGYEMPNGNNATCTPFVNLLREYYYYVIVTNTNDDVKGESTASVVSRACLVSVVEPDKIDAQAPSISSLTQSKNITENPSGQWLNVVVSVTQSGSVLSYQWFRNTENSNTGGTAISGAVDSSYQASTNFPGIYYYYVVITNTNDTVLSTKTAKVTSTVIRITVNAIVHAQKPVISVQPVGAPDVELNDSITLSVSASAPDGGKLSYQWYISTDSVQKGTAISGATNASYSVAAAAAGKFYYYVVITNTNNAVNGTRTATVTSNTVSIEVIVDAQIPSISEQPVGVTVDEGLSASLSVTALVTDDGELSYQWFSNVTNSNMGGTKVEGATSNTFSVPTTSAGTFYYYVLVTNTNDVVNGNQTASQVSSSVEVVVKPIVHAQKPIISPQQTEMSVTLNGSLILSVSASVTDGGRLSYQWYENDDNGNEGGTPISGEINENFTVPTTVAGTFYYYARVTNTNGAVNGIKTAAVTGNVIKVEVLVNAEAPIIGTNPGNATTIGRTVELNVAATVGKGTLSYQWYKSTTNSNAGGTAVSGATGSTFSPILTQADVTAVYAYYYVVVTNTDTSATGVKTASATSNVSVIHVKNVVDVLPVVSDGFWDENNERRVYSGQARTITAIWKHQTMDIKFENENLNDLLVGEITYQWYVRWPGDTEFTKILGATIGSYEFHAPADFEGEVEFQLELTHTNNKVNGEKVAVTRSYSIWVTVVMPSGEPAPETGNLSSNVLAAIKKESE